ASRMALSVWSGGLRRDEFFALWSFRRSQAGEVGRGVDVKLAPRQGDSVDGFGVPGQDGSSAAVATQLAQLGEVGGGEEGGNAQGAGIAGGDDAVARLAPCKNKGAEVSLCH